MSSDVPACSTSAATWRCSCCWCARSDVDSLKMYGRRCVDLVWWLENAAQRGVHTTVLVQGDTLGGGLESVLPFHKVIFERSAQAGFPEVLFNLFPGMGAWNFTIRKAGFAVANEMILSRPPLHRRPAATGAAWSTWSSTTARARRRSSTSVRTVDPRLRGTLAALQAQRLAAPITYESLMAIVDQWAETALTPDRPRPAPDGAPGARPGAQGRRRRRGRGRGDQAHRTRHRLGRGAQRQHRLGRRVAPASRPGTRAAEAAAADARRCGYSQRGSISRSWSRV